MLVAAKHSISLTINTINTIKYTYWRLVRKKMTEITIYVFDDLLNIWNNAFNNQLLVESQLLICVLFRELLNGFQ